MIRQTTTKNAENRDRGVFLKKYCLAVLFLLSSHIHEANKRTRRMHMTSLPPAVARYTESVGVKDAEELRLYPDKPILVRSPRLGMVSGRVISEKEFLQVVTV